MRIAVAGGTGTVGRHAVALTREAGHEVVVLSRSRGVDVRSGEGLVGALEGAGVVIDTTSPGTIEQGPATEFFTEAAAALQHAGAERGVGHIVTLSIVGIDKTSFGYCLAKLAHVRAAAASGPISSSPPTVRGLRDPARATGVPGVSGSPHLWRTASSVKGRTERGMAISSFSYPERRDISGRPGGKVCRRIPLLSCLALTGLTDRELPRFTTPPPACGRRIDLSRTVSCAALQVTVPGDRA